MFPWSTGKEYLTNTIKLFLSIGNQIKIAGSFFAHLAKIFQSGYNFFYAVVLVSSRALFIINLKGVEKKKYVKIKFD